MRLQTCRTRLFPTYVKNDIDADNLSSYPTNELFFKMNT